MRKNLALRLSVVAMILLIALGSGVLLLRHSRAPRRPTAFVQNMGGVASLAFSPDGQKLVVASEGQGGRIAIYETGSWRKIRAWRVAASEQMFFSRDGKRLFTCESFSFGKNVGYVFTIWNVADGKRLSSWQLRNASKDEGKYFSSISSDLSLIALRHWNMVKGKGHIVDRLHIVAANSGKERSVMPITGQTLDRTEWINKDRWLLITGWDASTQLLRISDGKPVAALPPLNYTTITTDLKTLVGVRNDKARKQNGTLILHDLQTRRTQEIATDFTLLRWAYRLDDTVVISGAREFQRRGSTSRTDFVQIRSADGAEIKSEFASGTLYVGAHRKLLAFEQHNSNNPIYEIHRARDGQLIARLDADADVLNGNWELETWSSFQRKAFSPDGAWFVCGDEDGLLRCWRLPSN